MKTSIIYKIIALVAFFAITMLSFAQTDSIVGVEDLPYPIENEDPYAYGSSNEGNGFRLNTPENLQTEIEYNPETGEYEVSEKVGAYETYPGYSMSLNEYSDYYSEKNKKEYWQKRSKADRTGDMSEFGPSLEVGGEAFDRIFGSNVIDIKPQGAAELTFGIKRTTNKNPSYTKKQQSNTSFDFQNKIQMSVTGAIGDKVSLTIKYDTEAQFEFDNEMKLEYVGEEDEIIKRIELGNVSFSTNNSLMTGSQSLFGVKTELQFGKLYVSSVLSQQKGQFSSVESKGGARTEEFEVRASDYDENQHYFLAQYFREDYRLAFDQLPVISTNIIIRKVEVWVSQTSSGNKDARDIVAFAELGDEIDPAAGFDAPHRYKLPKNRNLYQRITSLSGIRSINTVSSALEGDGFEESVDFERFEQAELLKTTQYTVNNQLGYISFKSKINREKTVGIAIEYEYQGKIYKVGEFSSELASPNALVVKLLKGRRVSPEMKNWDLMMRNVYSIGGYQVSRENFFMEIFYEDDRTGTPINYLPTGPDGVRGVSLLKLLDFDKLTEDNQPFEDGMYDFVEGVTAYASNGKIFLTKPEPFGEDLKRKFGFDTVSAEEYIYTELYDSTKVKAKEFIDKNKFVLRGVYESSSSSTIRMDATQVEPESVVVTAGGRKLTEGVDYTVNAEVGEVEIINSGLLESGTPIKVDYESNPLFSMQTKSMMGTRLEYRFNDNFNLGGTILRLKETPLSHKVGFEDFPINNTMWGLDGTYSTSSRFLTRMVDKIPLINTKEISKLTVSGEFAQLVPKISPAIDPSIEIDYFENTQRKYSLMQMSAWQLAGTPQGTRRYKEAEVVNDLSYSYRRAHVAWYDINSDFYRDGEDLASDAELSDVYAHSVYRDKLFPNYDAESSTRSPMSVMNFAYYPNERGQYNFTVDGLDPATGKLLNPEQNWGGIMRDLRTTDFDESNVEYIEFWMMDPFHYEDKHTGGDLFINLGDISEDILPDGRKSAENGVTTDTSKYDNTVWGRVPNYYVIEDRFDNSLDRESQDVGYDGLTNSQEQSHYALTYLDGIRRHITNQDVLNDILADPSNDDFHSYTDFRGQGSMSIVERYRYINNAEGNSPSGGVASGGITDYPEVEDVNGNFTLDVLEDYYEYQISLRPRDMVVGQNYITAKITENADLPDGNEDITWYQFKVPIRSADKRVVGNISSFQNIQFMRMYMTNFSDDVILRFAELDFVTSSWRKYNEAMFEPGDYDVFDDSEFDISVVNIEEDSEREPVNYVLPPGVDRVVDPMNEQARELNEQSLELKVVDLDDGNSKAVFKTIDRDYRQFGKINMFIHAEALTGSELEDGELYAFIRIGSDFKKNYYEYEIPLSVTPARRYSNNSESDKEAVWPETNNLEVDFAVFTELKKERNARISAGENIDLVNTYSSYDGPNKSSIKGNPNLGNVRTIMLGVRNRKKTSDNSNDDGLPHSAIVWFNELRLTDFDDKGGWAATAQARVDFADFASVAVAGKTTKAGFGGIDQKLFDRTKEDLYQYDVGSNVALNKFFPEKLGLSIPFYTGVSETFIIPVYDPTNPDLRMKESLDILSTDEQRDSLKKMTIDYTRRSSFNFTNVRMNPEGGKNYPWSVKNFSTSYGFSKSHTHNVNTIHDNEFQHKAAFNYNYVLRPKPFEPFKKSIKNKQLKIIRDFNVYYLPVSVSMSNDWNKRYREIKRRNFYLPDSLATETYSKKFNWDRTYNLKYNFSKGLKFDYTAQNQSRIDEPYGKIDKESEDWDPYKDEVIDNLQKFGLTTGYNQRFSATYKLPINKIVPLSWVSSNYRYTGNYTWTRGAEMLDLNTPDARDTYTFYGHNIKNSNNQSIDGNFNFKTLYKKNKYLKSVDKKYSRSRRRTTKAKTKNVKYNKTGVDLKEGKAISINHRLGTEDVKLNIVDSKGALVKGDTEIVSKNKIVFTPKASHEGVKVVVNGKKKQEETFATNLRDRFVYTSMMVKSVTLNYSWNNGSYIPHYYPTTKYVGLDDPFGSSYANPGWDYVFGYVPSHDELVDRSKENNWFEDPLYGFSTDYRMNEKYARTYGDKLAIKATVEPIKEFKINLTADRSYSRNYTQFLDYTESAPDGVSNGLVNGNYSISFNSISTSFNSDKAFEDLKENRLIIAERLASQSGLDYEHKADGFPTIYSPNSQDVLIPAFLSAYSGQAPEEVYTDDYFMPLFNSFKDFARSLNWRVSYTGLTKIKKVKKVFKRISINHSYKSNYSIGNYQSFTIETDDDGFFVNPATGEATLAPAYEVSAISISERFSPLIGVDMRWKSNFTSKFEVKNNRSVTLAFANSEISENGGMEYVVGAGYVFKNFVLNMNTAGGGKKAYDNDLTIKADFSVRNNLTVRRNIVQDVTQKISGQKVYSFKAYAEYMLTERFTARVFLDHIINNPVTNGYRTSNSNFGINLRFSLI